MDQETSRIRREKWLQTQQRLQRNAETKAINNDNIQDSIQSTSNSSEKAHKEEEIIDITSSPECVKPQHEQKEEVFVFSERKKHLGKPKAISQSIDLTVSDSDDENADDSLVRSKRCLADNTYGNATNSYNSPRHCSTSQTEVPIQKKRNMSNNVSSFSSHQSLSVLPNFSICTYNIWFGPPHPSRRMIEISNIISNIHPKPLFIGLQEVTYVLLKELQPLFESMGYRIIGQYGSSSGGFDFGDSYGVAIAVLTRGEERGAATGEIGSSLFDNSSTTTSSSLSYSSKASCHVEIINSAFCPFQNTIMDRGLLWVHGKILTNNEENSNQSSFQNRDILFTTTHLESFIPKNQYPLLDSQNHDGAQARKNQILETVQFCKEFKKNHDPMMILITGDLNWDDERKRGNGKDKNLLSLMNNSNDGNMISEEIGGRRCQKEESNCISGWKGAWKVCHPNNDGYTYDSKLNPMLKGNLRRRFDRCIYYTKDSSKDAHGSGTSLRGREENNYDLVVVKNATLVGTSTIDGIQWTKEVPEWKYGKPTGKMSKQVRPVCPSDHFGLVIAFGGSSANHNAH